MKVVVDSLQIAQNYSGLGRQVLSIGRELARLPEDVDLDEAEIDRALHAIEGLPTPA